MTLTRPGLALLAVIAATATAPLEAQGINPWSPQSQTAAQYPSVQPLPIAPRGPAIGSFAPSDLEQRLAVGAASTVPAPAPVQPPAQLGQPVVAPTALGVAPGIAATVPGTGVVPYGGVPVAGYGVVPAYPYAGGQPYAGYGAAGLPYGAVPGTGLGTGIGTLPGAYPGLGYAPYGGYGAYGLPLYSDGWGGVGVPRNYGTGWPFGGGISPLGFW